MYFPEGTLQCITAIFFIFKERISVMKILYCTILLFVLTACQRSEKPISAESARTVLRANWDAFSSAWENEDAEKCASFYAQDARNIPPGMEPKEGKEAIRDFYQMLFDNNLSSEYNHQTVNIDVAGADLIEEGAFKVNWVRNDSSTWTYETRSIAHWVQNEDGRWLIKKFLFNNP